jgi:hypothetical protein
VASPAETRFDPITVVDRRHSNGIATFIYSMQLQSAFALIVLWLALLPMSLRAQDESTTETGLRSSDCPGVESSSGQRAEAGRAFTVIVEEDNIQVPTHTDRNYTMGIGLAWSGQSANNNRLVKLVSLADAGIARFVDFASSKRVCYPIARNGLVEATSGTLTGTAFTPRDLRIAEILPQDRPYAFLLGFTVRHAVPARSEGYAWSSEWTFGTIGSDLGHQVQAGIHSAMRSLNKKEDSPARPRGWGNQILQSPLGIPTFRYALGYERAVPLLNRGTSRKNEKYLQVTYNAVGQIGYYTEADLGVTGRVGIFSSPFWQFRPNPLNVGSRAGYAQPRQLEGFVFINASQRFVAYNALLQGYGSYRSEYRLHSDDISRSVREFAYGASVVYSRRSAKRSIGLTWIPDAFRTHEFNGPNSRTHHWGSIFASFGRW